MTRIAGQNAATGKKRDAYHHGDLREALITAADAVLAESGVAGFTLRETARRAGVSVAAPAHHFGNTTGLLTAVAKRSYQELRERLRAAREEAERSGDVALHALGAAYVRFAIERPGRFTLMSADKWLKEQDPELAQAAFAAFAELQQAVEAHNAAEGKDAGGGQVAAIGAWALTHGFATLALGGKMLGVSGKPNIDALVDEYLPAVLENLFPAPRQRASRGR